MTFITSFNSYNDVCGNNFPDFVNVGTEVQEGRVLAEVTQLGFKPRSTSIPHSPKVDASVTVFVKHRRA